MAATGLPNPQPDHAIRMTKFAKECIEKLNIMLHQLEDSLGEDTLELGMRIGIHSGGVTAGVLRGDKSRFQLFGDTGKQRFAFLTAFLSTLHVIQLINVLILAHTLFPICSQYSIADGKQWCKG